MNYKNEKINITIENADFFEIKELDNSVQLLTNGTLMFEIYKNSKVYAYNESKVYAYNESKVYAYNELKVYACNESKVYAYNESKVYANHKSTVYAYNESTVYANHKSTVYAYQFSVIFKLSAFITIKKNNHFGSIIEQVFTVYEDMLVYKKLKENLIATLQLKKGQVFQSEKHYKCRTDKALVVSIESIDGKKTFSTGISQHDSSFIYKVGEIVSTNYDEEINECSTGIHFFLTRKEAEEY